MIRKDIFLQVVLILSLWSGSALAAKAQDKQWMFRSKYDNFTINYNYKNRKYFIGHSAVSLEPLKGFMPFFSEEVEGDCPDKFSGQPDAVITVKRGKKTIKRHFYLEDKQVRDGNKCSDMIGEGIYYLPLHRSWFLGPHKGKVTLGHTLKVKIEGIVFVEFKKKGRRWVNKDSGFFTNWDFFHQFLATLKKYQISGRLHPLADKGKQFQVITNNQTYQFFQVDDNLWGIKHPQKGWINISPSFSFLMDMSTDMWRSRHAMALATLKDSTQPADSRIEVINQISAVWNQTVKQVFYAIMLDSEENPQVKIKIVSIMRAKPTTENFEILIQALGKTEDIELLSKITNALRVRNRKGPLIQVDNSQKQVLQSIRTWKKWWQTKGSEK